MGLLRF
jgi:hypothetical protein